MKLCTLFKKISFSILFAFAFLHFSFGQNATNGGEIGIFDNNSSTFITTATYMVGDVPDTILNITNPSGGNDQLDLEYFWAVGENLFSEDPALGIINKEYYIPPTDIPGNFFYHRDARREGFTNFQAASNIIIIEILPMPVSTELLETSVAKIYPNPVTTYLQIELKENSSPDWLVEIFDIKGSLQKTIKFKNVQDTQTINVHDLAKGTYLIQLTDLENNKTEHFKILKE